jgi:hypothetical protein
MLLRTISLVISLTLAVGAAVITSHEVTAATACDYYASPNGGGNGLSQSSPFKITNFWTVASPGKTLCLLDGVYADSSSVIAPPQNLNGTQAAPITIKAVNDGTVLIDGSGVRSPVHLVNNDWLILEGFNAHNAGQTTSTGTVVDIGSGADNNIVRRVCAWNAADNQNTEVFTVHQNTGNLLEDVCAFGIGRKMITNSQGGNNAVVRRAWVQWTRETSANGKDAVSVGYNSYNGIFENIIATWNESSAGTGTRDGILRFGPSDAGGRDPCHNSHYYGSIAYIQAADTVPNLFGMLSNNDDSECHSYNHVVAYLEPGSHTNIPPIKLRNVTALVGPPGQDMYIRNVTTIGGASNIIASEWTQVNNSYGATAAAVPNIWNGAGTRGARVCNRYLNGVLTSQPLWPWPMNERIIDAMKTAGKTPVDVTRTMEQIFGPIPRECRSDLAVPAAPVSPTHLVVSNGK